MTTPEPITSCSSYKSICNSVLAEGFIAVRTTPPEGTIIFLSLLFMLFGAWLLFVPGVFLLAPKVYGAIGWLPQKGWGATALILGTLQLYSTAITHKVKWQRVLKIPTFVLAFTIACCYTRDAILTPDHWKLFSLPYWWYLAIACFWCLYRVWSNDHDDDYPMRAFIDPEDINVNQLCELN